MNLHEDICPDCHCPWIAHDFGVPKPYCPTKKDLENWRARYDEDGDMEHAMNFLRSRGYTSYRYMISPPTEKHVVLPDERLAVEFLMEEWDWGWSTVPLPR